MAHVRRASLSSCAVAGWWVLSAHAHDCAFVYSVCHIPAWASLFFPLLIFCLTFLVTARLLVGMARLIALSTTRIRTTTMVGTTIRFLVLCFVCLSVQRS